MPKRGLVRGSPSGRAAAVPAPRPKKVSAETSSTQQPKQKGRAQARNAAELPAFVEPQLCQSVERPPAGPGGVHEIKFDGYRVQARISGGQALLRTRKGLNCSSKFSAIAVASSGLPDAIVYGGIVALDASGAPDFAALQAALSKEDAANLIFFVFDLLFANGEDLRALPLSERKSRLEKLLAALPKKGGPLQRYLEHFDTGGDAVLQSACKLSLEGIVSKRIATPRINLPGFHSQMS
jgi:bifunctional non-homologous end joining protein LigD